MANPIIHLTDKTGKEVHVQEPVKVKTVFTSLDVDEESGKTTAAVGSYLTKLVSSKKQAKVFSEGHKLAKVVQTKREKVLPSATLTQHEETIQLKKSIDQEAQQRQEREKALLSESKFVQRIAIKNFLEKAEGVSNTASGYLNTGFDIANKILDAGKSIEDFLNKVDITRSPEFEVAWKSIEDEMKEINVDKSNIDSVREDFVFYVKLSIECVQLDLEIEMLENVRAKIIEKKAKISRAREKEKKALKIELNQLRLLEKTQKKKVEGMQDALSLKGLNALVSEGTKYVEAISTLMKTGSTARSILGHMTKQLALLGSLLNFTTAVGKMIRLGKTIHEAGKKIDLLKNEQKAIPDHLNPLTKLLINNAYSFKIMHMERSKILLKAEAAFSMLRAIIASVELSQASIACIAILCGVVIATPGLNTASVVLGILIVVGIKSIEVLYKMKHDRTGTKLELQQNEESMKIFALSGQFHTKTREYQKVRLELEVALNEEAQMTALMKEFYKKADEYSHSQFEAIEAYWMAQLTALVDKRSELNKKHEEFHNELYMMSLELDATISQKNVLKDHRSMETLAQEFRIQKSDLLGMAGLFQETLKESEEVREEFIEFLTSKGIAITSEEDIFASVLRFIRADEEMPVGVVEGVE